jgi:hypothetical protein
MALDPWVIGCIIYLCGSVIINIGTNLIKYAHALEARQISAAAHRSSSANVDNNTISSGTAAHPQHSFWWFLGFGLFFVGNVSNFISMGFTAQSLLAGLGSIQFITNVICSAILMKTKVTSRILWATFLIITGNFLIVLFASHSSSQLDVYELLNLYYNQAFIIYMIVLVIILLSLFIYYKETKKKLIANLPNPHAKINYTHHKMMPFSYATISAIIGTQSVLLAKSCSQLIRTSLGGNNQFIHPFTYFLLAAWVLSMVFWLYRMNEALRKFDGVFIIPVLQVVWTLFSIIGGGIYFEEFSEFSIGQIFLFTFGVATVVLGVHLLAPQTGSQQGATRGENSSDLIELDEIATENMQEFNNLGQDGPNNGQINAEPLTKSSDSGSTEPESSSPQITVALNEEISPNTNANNNNNANIPQNSNATSIRQYIAAKILPHNTGKAMNYAHLLNSSSNTNSSIEDSANTSNNSTNSSSNLSLLKPHQQHSDYYLTNTDSPTLHSIHNHKNSNYYDDDINNNAEISTINHNNANIQHNPHSNDSNSHIISLNSSSNLNDSVNSVNSTAPLTGATPHFRSSEVKSDVSAEILSAPSSPSLPGMENFSNSPQNHAVKRGGQPNNRRGQHKKKKNKGISLGFSMPLIDLDNEQ